MKRCIVLRLYHRLFVNRIGNQMRQHNRDVLENPLQILLNDGAAGCNRDPSRRSLICITVPRSQQFIVTAASTAADYYLFAQASASIAALSFATALIFIEYPINFSSLHNGACVIYFRYVIGLRQSLSVTLTISNDIRRKLHVCKFSFPGSASLIDSLEFTECNKRIVVYSIVQLSL